MKAGLALIALSFVCVVSPNGNAVVPSPLPGRPWTPHLSARGDADVSMRYAYDRLTLWALTITPEASPTEARLLERPLTWRLYDEASGRVYQDWTPARRNEEGAVEFELRRVDAVRALLPNLTTAVLVIAGDRGVAVGSIPLKTICETHAKLVLDMTNLYAAPCAVTAKALPTISQACAQEAKRVDQAMKAKRLTCNAGNDRLGALGCDYMMCP